LLAEQFFLFFKKKKEKKNKNKKTLLLSFYWPLKRERYPVKRLRATLEKRKKEA